MKAMIRIKENRKIPCVAAWFIGMLLVAVCATTAVSGPAGAMGEVARISPQDAYAQMTAGQALLVCAYADEKACGTNMLEGAISLKEFESGLAGFKKDQPIIFYCA
jgi:hypothetical protein